MIMRLNTQSNQLIILFRKFFQYIIDVNSISCSRSKYTMTLSKRLGLYFSETQLNRKNCTGTGFLPFPLAFGG